jgi:hypothetical protein
MKKKLKRKKSNEINLVTNSNEIRFLFDGFFAFVYLFKFWNDYPELDLQEVLNEANWVQVGKEKKDSSAITIIPKEALFNEIKEFTSDYLKKDTKLYEIIKTPQQGIIKTVQGGFYYYVDPTTFYVD